MHEAETAPLAGGCLQRTARSEGKGKAVACQLPVSSESPAVVAAAQPRSLLRHPGASQCED